MTRSEVRDLAAFYAGEPDLARYETTRYNMAINVAQRIMQQAVLRVSECFWLAKARFTYSSGLYSVSLTEKLDFALRGRPWKWLTHGTLASDADPAAANDITPMQVVTFFRLRETTDTSRTYYPQAPGEIAYSGFAGSTQTLRGAIQGDYLYAWPAPTTTTYCYFEWIPVLPRIPDGTEGDATPVLGGVLEQFHEALAIRAAMEVLTARGANPERLRTDFEEHTKGILGLEKQSASVPMVRGGVA